MKKLEELGIGRPSTYASILSVLQDRKYVRLEKRRFIPEDRGRLVTAFLVSFFEHYVDTGFTAAMEEQLDDISGGHADWRAMMRAFWDEFSHAVDQTKDLKISDVIAALDEDLGPHFFPPREDGSDPRACPACGNGRLGLKLGRYGSFIGCSNYPNCQYTRAPGDRERRGPGRDAEGGHARARRRIPTPARTITVRRGPYGLYVQQGENGEDKGKKDEAAPHHPAARHGRRQITLEQALGLLSLPRVIGMHPETREKIEAGIGRFGPYVRMGAIYGSLDRDDDVLAIGINRAVDLIARKMASVRTLGAASRRQGTGRGAQGPLRSLCAARQDGGQPAARRDDGRDHAGRGGGAAGGEGQAVAAARRGRTARSRCAPAAKPEAALRNREEGAAAVQQGEGRGETAREGQARQARQAAAKAPAKKKAAARAAEAGDSGGS